MNADTGELLTNILTYQGQSNTQSNSKKPTNRDSSVQVVVDFARKHYNDTQGKLDILTCTTSHRGIKRYYENGKLKKVLIPNGVDCEVDFQFGREYYYEDNEVYFALWWDDEGNTLRYYLCNDQLIRFIDADGGVRDNQRDNYGFTKYEGIILSEAEYYST